MDTPDKKHPCPDCGFCQWCGDDRCRLCRECRPAAGRKLSLAGQIELYEGLNSGKKKDGACKTACEAP